MGRHKSRRRLGCQFVDPRTGLRCRKDVKTKGCKYCSRACYHAARPKQTRDVSQGAWHLARAKKAAFRAEVAEQLRAMADDKGRVPLTAALPIVYDRCDERYKLGYTAGTVAAGKHARHLRLTVSRVALDEFIGSNFGKAFVTGELEPEALARFSFAGTR